MAESRQCEKWHLALLGRRRCSPDALQTPNALWVVGGPKIRIPNSEFRILLASLLSQKRPILLREIGGNCLDDPFSGFDRRQLGM